VKAEVDLSEMGSPVKTSVMPRSCMTAIDVKSTKEMSGLSWYFWRRCQARRNSASVRWTRRYWPESALARTALRKVWACAAPMTGNKKVIVSPRM
jgi:hypothetical protein